MKEKIKVLKEEIAAFRVENQEQLEQFRLKYIGRKSLITDLFSGMGNLSPEERKEYGVLLNDLKDSAQQRFKEMISELETKSALESAADHTDVTLPPVPGRLGSLHPITITRARIVEIFERLGFNISEGPEIEDDWHNFTALNFPEDHPAREMQDTFFIEKNPDIALRTHTSSVQIRVLEKQKPPIRTLAPGRVFRNEAISVRAHCYFHQIEGFYIHEDVSFRELKQTLLYFAREFFGADTKIRLRPSFFPFTEPSAEMDVSCFICGQKGCRVCKNSGWVEILGCGMIDPAVLQNCGIDPERYTGYAFGMGLERITMLKYNITDIRMFSENDVRFLRQFRKAF